VLRETVLAAALAGIAASLLLTLLQFVWVTPLILTGETYEDRAAALEHSHPPAISAEHHHDENAWKPQNGLERSLFTVAANALVGVGYAFVLIAVFLFWRAPKSLGWGVAFGLAGFVVFFVAPALGLPPELPGTAAAELTSRQEWWAMTALATGAGLFLFFSQPRWWIRALGVVLVIAPHLVPAPQPAVEASLAPPDLQTHFRIATTACNAVFWVALGMFTTFAFRRLGLTGTPPQTT
jgi:cobalt transporter subunit CbtA